jgi:hypothetical protein
MKKSILALSVLLVLASLGLAQNISITPKKIVHKRIGKQVPREKRTFVVTYPLVSGSIAAATKKRLENTISYWRVFETTLQENQGEYHWLSEMSYTVNYNKNGILDIALTQEGVGAYPDGQTVNLVVDLKTGEAIKFRDVFKSNSLTRFAEMVNTKLNSEKQDTIQRINRGEFGGENDKEANESLKEQVSGLIFTAETFNEFSINDKGVTIIYDAGFPHVIKAAQPDGRYFFTWAELKPFIKPDGLLGRFVR